jgi:hypothetical protein
MTPQFSTALSAESLEARFLREIHKALDEHISELREKVIANAMQEFERGVREQVGKFAINLAKYYSVERMGDNLQIVVTIAAQK